MKSTIFVPCHHTEDVRNWTDTQIAGEMLQTAYSTSEKVFIPLIFAIGFIGNVTFLIILGKVKRMRTVTNFYLANLATADLIVLSIELFVRILRYVNFNHVKGQPFYTDFGSGGGGALKFFLVDVCHAGFKM